MTNQMSYLATLAAATRLCDSCDGRGMFEITVGNGDEGGGCHLEDERCVTCDGTGKVLLIPGLRVECDGYTLFDDMDRPRHLHRGINAGWASDCPGYGLLTPDEAVVVVIRWLLDNGYNVLFPQSNGGQYCCSLRAHPGKWKRSVPDALFASTIKRLKL